MNLKSVFNYQEPRQFLLDSLASKQVIDTNFSIRRWAKEMELKSHSLLVMLLQGKREIKIQHCSFLLKGLELNTNESAYLQTLIQYQNAKTIEEKRLISGFLQDLHPGEGFSSKDIDQFIVISNWVYMTIMAMTELKDFKGTEEEISKRLGNKVSLTEIRSAIIRLMDLELIRWNEKNKLTPTHTRISTKDDISNEGAKEYHRQVIELAKNAIEEQSLDQREFQSFSMAISEENIALAKEMIRKFRAKLSKAVSGNGDHVYQTNIQFFRLTEN